MSRKLILFSMFVPLGILLCIFAAFIIGAICIPIILFRLFLATVVPFVNKDFGTIVSSNGTFFHQKRFNPSWIFYVEGELSLEHMHQFFLNKVINLKDKTGNPKYPQLQQYIQNIFGFLFWKWDKDFKIENHIRIYDASQDKNLDGIFINLQRNGTNEFPNEKKSPWNFFLVRNHPDLRFLKRDPKNISAVIFQCNHVLVDAFSALLIIYQSMAGMNLTPFRAPQKSNLIVIFLKMIRIILHKTYLLFANRNKLLDNNQLHLRNLSPNYVQEVSTTMSELIPQTLFKSIQEKYKVCRSSVIFSCITAALRNIMIQKGMQIPEQIILMQPYPRENHPDALINHFDVVEIRLPIGNGDPLERLRFIRKEIVRSEDGAIQLASGIAMKFIGSMPNFIVRVFGRNIFSTVSWSRVQSQSHLTLFGKNVVHHSVTCNMTDGDVPFHFYCNGYHDYLQFCMHVNKELLNTEEEKDLYYFMTNELLILQNASH